MRVGEALDTKIVAVNHEDLFKKLNLKLNFGYEQTLIDSIEFYKSLGKDYLIKSLVKFLNHAQLLDLLDSIDREIF